MALYKHNLEHNKLSQIRKELEDMGAKVYGVFSFENFDELRIQAPERGQEEQTYWRVRIDPSVQTTHDIFMMEKCVGDPSQESLSNPYWLSDARTTKEMYEQLMHKETCFCQDYFSRENVVEAFSNRAGLLINDLEIANQLADALLPNTDDPAYKDAAIDSDGILRQGRFFMKITPVLQGENKGTLSLFSYNLKQENMEFLQAFRDKEGLLKVTREGIFDLKQLGLSCSPEKNDMLLLSSALEKGIKPEAAIKCLNPQIIKKDDRTNNGNNNYKRLFRYTSLSEAFRAMVGIPMENNREWDKEAHTDSEGFCFFPLSQFVNISYQPWNYSIDDYDEEVKVRAKIGKKEAKEFLQGIVDMQACVTIDVPNEALNTIKKGYGSYCADSLLLSRGLYPDDLDVPTVDAVEYSSRKYPENYRLVSVTMPREYDLQMYGNWRTTTPENLVSSLYRDLNNHKNDHRTYDKLYKQYQDVKETAKEHNIENIIQLISQLESVQEQTQEMDKRTERPMVHRYTPVEETCNNHEDINEDINETSKLNNKTDRFKEDYEY